MCVQSSWVSKSQSGCGWFAFIFKWGGGLYPTRRRPCRFSHCPQGQLLDNAISCCFVFVHALAWRNCAAGGILRCRKHGGIMRCSQVFGGLNLLQLVFYPIGERHTHRSSHAPPVLFVAGCAANLHMVVEWHGAFKRVFISRFHLIKCGRFRCLQLVVPFHAQCNAGMALRQYSLANSPC